MSNRVHSGVISGSGGNFKNLIVFLGIFPCCTTLTIKMKKFSPLPEITTVLPLLDMRAYYTKTGAISSRRNPFMGSTKPVEGYTIVVPLCLYNRRVQQKQCCIVPRMCFTSMKERRGIDRPPLTLFKTTNVRIHGIWSHWICSI